MLGSAKYAAVEFSTNRQTLQQSLNCIITVSLEDINLAKFEKAETVQTHKYQQHGLGTKEETCQYP